MLRVLEELKKKLKLEGRTLEASYSTLTWFCRENGIGRIKEKVPQGGS